MESSESSPNVMLLISHKWTHSPSSAASLRNCHLSWRNFSLYGDCRHFSQSIRGERYSICSHLSHRAHLFFSSFFQPNDIFLSKRGKKIWVLWSFNLSSFCPSYSFSFVSNGSILCKSDKGLYHYAIIFESSIIVAFLPKSLK